LQGPCKRLYVIGGHSSRQSALDEAEDVVRFKLTGESAPGRGREILRNREGGGPSGDDRGPPRGDRGPPPRDDRRYDERGPPPRHDDREREYDDRGRYDDRRAPPPRYDDRCVAPRT
jgi:hypothetical protein